MAEKIEDSGVSEQNVSASPPPARQPEENIKDLDAQGLSSQPQHYKQYTPALLSEATIIANPEAESGKFELPSTPSEAEVKPAAHPSTVNENASDTQQQRDSHLLEGTINWPPGGTLIAETLRLSSESEPATKMEEAEPCTTEAIDAPNVEATDSASEEKEEDSPSLEPQQEDNAEQVSIAIEEEPYVEDIDIVHADPQQHSNTCTEEDLNARASDTPVEVVVLIPADDQKITDIVPPPETAEPSERDEAIGIAKKMDPANWPQPAGMQETIEEVKTPSKLPDDDQNCSMQCYIPCKRNLGYKFTKRKCIALRKGATTSVLQWWTDGLTPRWKLLYILCSIVIYLGLLVAAIVKLSMNISQGEHIVFDSFSFAFTALGSIISIGYAIIFSIRRRKEVLTTMCEAFIGAVLWFYCCCCCCCKISYFEKLKEEKVQKKSSNKIIAYIEKNEKFEPPRNSLQKIMAYIGNTSEVLLTIVDDVILTVVFIISLYSFMGKEEFTIFYGVTDAAHVLGFCILALSSLKLIFSTHGLRIFSIAWNIRALDLRIARDSKAMGLDPPNTFIQYFLSFQARLAYHVVVSSTFQLYGIFALSWKIIQDSCTVVTPPVPVGNETDISPLSGAPFTCNIPHVNGFTLYNIVYIAFVPTLLGYTSFFLCNTPWLVEYMQTITRWTYLQIEYTTGYREREDAKQEKEVNDADCRVPEDGGKAANISPQTRLLRIFCSNLLCDVTEEELKRAGANAEEVRKTIQKDYETDAEMFGTNVLSRAITKFGKATFFVPAAIISVLQVVLFILHLVLLGCGTRACFSSDLHAVFSSIVFNDVASLYIPLIVLFAMTSFPGPWIGVFWLIIIFGVILLVPAIVAFIFTIVALFFIFFLAVCTWSTSNERRIN